MIGQKFEVLDDGFIRVIDFMGNDSGLRMDAHAQHEIRQYANVIGREIVAKWVPHAWEAFVDYRLEGQAFSREELRVLGLAINRDRGNVEESLDGSTLSDREVNELYTKLGLAQ